MNRQQIVESLGSAFPGIPAKRAGDRPFYKGKVRDIIDLGDQLIVATSDRISAFDQVLGCIPFKGQVLNQMALFWFKATSDIIDNHVNAEVSARSVLVDKCQVLPVEVIVRGYLTGSAWRDYQSGNPVSGIVLPLGMRRDQNFDAPLITPSTKAEQGDHDLPISTRQIVSRGLVEKDLWEEVEQKALALFARGTEVAARQGLILVDTKYEFGLRDGKLVLVDEVHTPDSSRYWYADSYQKCFDAGTEQRKMDKEFLRSWLMEQGWMGEGQAPELPDAIRIEVAMRYIEAFESLCGLSFVPDSKELEEELALIEAFF